MHTPAHAVLNLALLCGCKREADWRPVLVGSLLPDAPMWVFYLVERGIRGLPDVAIWSDRYFDPLWQAIFDLPNALPLIAVAFAVAKRNGMRWLTLVCASMGLHALTDLPLHHDDGHRHFWPLSDFRFASPVSYWDPAHHGIGFLGVELALVAGLGVWLATRQTDSAYRSLLAVLLLGHGAYLAYAFLVWT